MSRPSTRAAVRPSPAHAHATASERVRQAFHRAQLAAAGIPQAAPHGATNGAVAHRPAQAEERATCELCGESPDDFAGVPNTLVCLRCAERVLTERIRRAPSPAAQAPAPTPAPELPPAARIGLDLEHVQELLEQVLADDGLAEVAPELARRALVEAVRAVAAATALMEATGGGLLVEPGAELDAPLRCRDCGGPSVAAPRAGEGGEG